MRDPSRIAAVVFALVALASCDGAPRATSSVSTPNTPAAAARFACTNEWTPFADGMEYRQLDCDESARSFALHLVRIDPQRVELAGLIAPGATARGVATNGGWQFAINANFFDAQLQPLGVVMADGKLAQREHPVSWQSIFVIDRRHRAHIVPAAAWSSVRDEAEAAVQAGPRLITAGKRNAPKRADPDWRSGVCIDPEGRAIVFATPHESRFDVTQMVDLAEKIGCRDAMLFDGGPSTQLYVARPTDPVDLDGDRSVPAFLAGRQRPLKH